MLHHKHILKLEDFGFASSKLSQKSENLLRDFARTIVLGSPAVPPLARVTKVLVTGHGKGTNPEKHAFRRGKRVHQQLLKLLEAFGASSSDRARVDLGTPVTVKLKSNGQVTGKDRKVTIGIYWPDRSKRLGEDPATALARDWVQQYYSRRKMSGWEAIGETTFGSTAHEKAGTKKVWVGPERLWAKEMQSASLVEKYLENYAGILHFAAIQGFPDLKNPRRDQRDFMRHFKGKLDRRIRLYEIEEFLTALYTAEPVFGAGPTLRALRHAIARVIERFQGAVILRISKERWRPTRRLFGVEQLKPVAEGGGLLVQRAMIKNAIYTATSALLTVRRSHSLELAKSIAKNCGTIVGYAVKEQNALLRKDENLLSLGLDVVFVASGPVLDSVGKTGSMMVKAVLKEMIKSASVGLDKIKTEFERQANVLEDSGENPMLTNDDKMEIVQEFRGGCDTSLEP